MADNTKIEWTEATWNPIRAVLSDADGTERKGWHCEHVSEGCRNCYAEGFNRRLGTKFDYKPGHLRGDVEVYLDEKMLLQPLKWKRPRQIFVCSMTDLFADFVTDEIRDRIFAVMALCPQHTFQVLTKRSARMREYCTVDLGTFSGTTFPTKQARAAWAMWNAAGNYCISNKTAEHYIQCLRQLGGFKEDNSNCYPWPLPNVWLGVSVENQAAADERIPDLLSTPAAVRWISAEPLLGPVDLTQSIYRGDGGITMKGFLRDKAEADDFHYWGTKIDWVVAGGESGKDARPMHPDWARSLRDQCAAAGTPFFFKQWGNWLPCHHIRDQARPYNWKPEAQDGSARVFEFRPDQGQSTIIPQNPTTRSPDDQFFWWFSKKAAGRLLDGVLHDGILQTGGAA